MTLMEEEWLYGGQQKLMSVTFFRSAKIRGLPLLHITDVPRKSNSILAMSSSISSLSRSAITTTIPPHKLSLAMASWFSRDPWECEALSDNIIHILQWGLLKWYFRFVSYTNWEEKIFFNHFTPFWYFIPFIKLHPFTSCKITIIMSSKSKKSGNIRVGEARTNIRSVNSGSYGRGKTGLSLALFDYK